MSDTGSTKSPEPASEPAPARSDERSYRILLVVVIVLGIALVISFFVVVGTIIYRLSTAGLPDRSSTIAEHHLGLDPGAGIVEIEATDGRLFLLVEEPDGARRVHVMDARRLTPEAVILPRPDGAGTTN